jgi:hypothetical protein
MPSDNVAAITPVSTAITVVSGLPRSGTSMMMRMLDAGGMPICTDNIRQANEDNPNGYFELEKIKQLEADATWLKQERGRAVKAISALLPLLPADNFYDVIFMRRDMAEILASQKKMLQRRGVTQDDIPDAVMAAKYETYLAATFRWIEKQTHLKALYVHYHEVVQDPWGQAQRVNAFLRNRLDVARMVAAVDPKLYRQRKQA